MTEVETDYNNRFDDVDVDSILARVERRPLTFARKRFLYQAPEFVKRLPAEETVEEGTTVSFACKIVGFPKPTVTWYKDDDVIGEGCRAITDSDENGIHSISLKDVSKCDSGVYKCKASNLEGSSANNLYVSVKAKTRNRKKTKKRIVTCAPPFPAIVERVAEEKRETLEVELQPESPLTPLYCNISLKSPVSWPAFLGEWAYCMEMSKPDDDDLEIGSEDVFDDENDQTTLNFNSCSANNSNVNTATEQNSNVDNMTDENRNCVLENHNDKETKELNMEKESVDITLSAEEVASRFQRSLPDIIKSKGKNHKSDLDTGQKHNHEPFRDKINKKEDTPYNIEDTKNNNTAKPVAIPPKTLDIKPKGVFKEDHGSVAKISVNRSYAKGESTFSVATRSSSPYPPCPMTDLKKTEAQKHVSHLENVTKSVGLVKVTESSSECVTWDDHVLEIVLLISGNTFLALCLDLPPCLFVINVLVALFIRVFLNFLLAEFRIF